MSLRTRNTNYVLANQSSAQNRFRKIVESVVQANRLAVEHAQKEDEENPNARRRRYDGELQRWCKDSSDTATWLYHLVFSSGASEPTASTQPKNRQYQGATVVTIDDNDALSDPSDSEFQDASDKIPLVRFERGANISSDIHPRHLDKIEWNAQTEPSLVVDRLLATWTFLPLSEIQASTAGYTSVQDKEWREGLISRIQKYVSEKERPKTKAKSGDIDSSDDEDDEIEEGDGLGDLPRKSTPLLIFTRQLTSI